MACLAAMRLNPVIEEFVERLFVRGQAGKSAVIAFMAKLLKIVYGALTHAAPVSAPSQVPDSLYFRSSTTSRR